MVRGVRGKKRKAVIDDTDSEVVLNVPKQKIIKRVSEDNDSAKENKPRRSPNGYLLPDPIPCGLVIADQRKNRWKVGKKIGSGGFGEIYSATNMDGNML